MQKTWGLLGHWIIWHSGLCWHSWSHWGCAMQAAVGSGSQEWEILNGQMNISHIKPFYVAWNEAIFPFMELFTSLLCHWQHCFHSAGPCQNAPGASETQKQGAPSSPSKYRQSWPVVGQEIKKLTLSSSKCDTTSASWEEIHPIRLNHCLST